MTGRGPHAGQPVRAGGAPIEGARLALVLLHGRGGSGADMLMLAEQVAGPEVACLAPDAGGASWWPGSFLAPLAHNEPGLTSGLQAIDAILRDLQIEGIEAGRVVLGGFSQGACLALELAARKGTSFAGVIGLSGGLLGTSDEGGPAQDDLYGYEAKRFDYRGDVKGTPVVLGCHARDPHIPLRRVRETAAVFERLGARVIMNIHPGTGHGIVDDDVRTVRSLLVRAGQ